jgi:zinc protease
VKPLVDKYFGPIPRGPAPPPVTAKTEAHTKEVRDTMRDRVQLAKVLIGYVGPKPLEHPAVAPLVRILAGGKSTRLYHDLVYEKKLALDVSATWDPSMQLGGVIEITATVQAGHTPEEVIAALSDEMRRLRDEPVAPEELARAKRNLESGLFAQLENVGGFGGKGDQLNYYELFAKDPGAFAKNLEATLAVTPAQVHEVAQQYLHDEQRVVITVLPEQKQASAGGGR